MKRALKALLGIACLVGGGILAATYIAHIVATITLAERSLSLVDLLGLACGAALLGASGDAFGFWRTTDQPEKNGIANSIWATEEHLKIYDIAEE